MKSIVHEASSIAKAIEQGLAKAGNPRDFAVKILEYPEKNFFGITTKPAKIALYIEEKSRKSYEPHGMPQSDKGEKSEKNRDYREQQDGRHHDRSRERSSHGDTRRERDTHQRSERAERSERQDKGEARGHDRNDRRERRSTRGENTPRQERDGSRYERPVTQDPMDSSHTTMESKKHDDSLVPRWNSDATRHAKDWLTRVLVEMHKLVPFSIEIDTFHLRIVLDRALFDNPEQERRALASLSLLLLETCKHACKLNLRGHKVVLSHKQG